jgi:hypothetical protein
MHNIMMLLFAHQLIIHQEEPQASTTKPEQGLIDHNNRPS